MKSSALRAALIVTLTIVTYLPAMRAGFVWDDRALITENEMLKSGDALHRVWLTTQAPDYYPLTWTLWWAQWRLSGDSPVGYHAVNVLLHAGNALLVWLVLQQLKIPGAWAAALIFAVHPVNVASVAWVSEQKNTLSMLFAAAATLLYLRFDEQPQQRWCALSLGMFLLALLSKSAVVMLPVVLWVCVWWRRGTLRWADVARTVPFFILAGIFGVITIWFQAHRALGGEVIRTVGFGSRLAGAGWAVWFYLYKALWPVGLTVIYSKWEWNSYAPGLLLVAGFVLCWWKRTTWGRPVLFGLGYFVVMLFPVLGFFDQGFYQYALVADHWQYYSIVGVIAVVVAATVRWRLALAAAVVMLAVASWRRSGVYADDVTLWTDNVAKCPGAWAHNGLGSAFFRLGKLDDAIREFERALQFGSESAQIHNNLGIALSQAGDRENAIRQFEQALEIKANYAEAHNNLGLALCQAGRLQEGIGYFEQALRIKPNYAKAHYNLAVALQQMGMTQEAISHYQEALRLKPDFTEAQMRLLDIQ